MALADVGRLYWPDPWAIAPLPIATSFPLFSSSANYVLNATNTRIGQLFTVGRAGTVTHLCVRTKTVTTAQTLRVGLYTVDASGNPTSTAYGSSAYATQASPSTDTQYEIDITDAAMTLNDQAAFIVEWNGTQGDVGMTVMASHGYSFGSSLVRYTTSWQTKADARLDFALKYDDLTYWAPYPYVHTATSRVYNAGTSGADEYALKFSMPFKCRAIGAYVIGYAWATGTNPFDFVLYEGTTSRASSVNNDGDAQFGGAVSAFYFASPYTLSAGTTYHLAAKPNTTANFTFHTPTVGSAAHFGTFPAGVSCYADRRIDGGAWANDVATEYLPVGLIIDQLDDGASAGAGSRAVIIGG